MRELVALLLAFSLSLVAGEALPPDPEIERKSFVVADGFDVQLFAADPLIAKPINMNFDTKGRLWVASSSIYPQIKPGEAASDKILILEDTDGDGKAEKTTVFADGLLIPTGVEVGDGGAYVANSTEIVHFKDTDGDGKADKKDIVLSGFGTEDTHHIIHTFRYGPNGLLHFNQSIYIHSHVETPHGVRRLNGGGIWNFRPKTRQLEVFIKGLVNPWGHAIDRWGQSFGTDGAGGEGVNYLLPGAYYVTSPGAQRLLQGLNPGQPKFCANEIVSGRHFPDDWQENMICNDFRANRVVRFVISEDGAGYAAKLMPDVIKSTNVAFRPIDVKMGPDGALYIADWYNPIINHGEVDFRDPRRDRVHGRIWRLTAKNRPLVERPKIDGAKMGALMEMLKAPEDYTRHFAKREIASRDPREVLQYVNGFVARQVEKDPLYEHNLLEALWVYQTIDVVNADLLDRLLRAKDGRVRAAATRALAHWHARVASPLQLLEPLVNDEHPRVRLEAVRTLAELKTSAAMETALRALDKPIDRFLDYALWLTANELKEYWLPAVESGQLTFNGNERHLNFALQAVRSPLAMKMLLAQLKDGKLPAENWAGLLDLCANVGNGDDASAFFDAIVSGDKADAGKVAAALAALQKAARRGAGVKAEQARLAQFFEGADNVKLEALRLAGAWRAETLRSQITAVATADQVGGQLRQAALDALAEIGGKESLDVLLRLSGPESKQHIRLLAMAKLVTLDAKAAAGRAADVLASDIKDDPTPLFLAFIKHSGADDALAAALENRKIPADAAKLGIRAAQTMAQQDSALVKALTKAGGLNAERESISPEEMKHYVDLVAVADPARGEALFRKAESGCLKCHGFAGAGGQVGPDMSSLGSAPVDYLIESMLLPNKKVKEGFHSVVIITKDGKVVSGVKLRADNSRILVRDADGNDISVSESSIRKSRDAGSIMPADVADLFTKAEVADLVRFLSELGKSPAYSAGNAQVARRWQVARESGWIPSYSTVSGVLPLSDVPEKDGASAARFELDVSKPGPVKLKINAVAGRETVIVGDLKEVGNGFKRFIGENVKFDLAPEMLAVAAEPEITLNLPAGINKITYIMDRKARKEGLRVELVDGAAKFIVGK